MKENTAAPMQTELIQGTLLCKVFIEAIILIRLKTTKHQQCQQLESREFCSFPTLPDVSLSAKAPNIRHDLGQETRTSQASGLIQKLLRRFNAKGWKNLGH